MGLCPTMGHTPYEWDIKARPPFFRAALPIPGGAEGGTRTRTDCSTRPSNVRGYQLRHLGLENYYLNHTRRRNSNRIKYPLFLRSRFGTVGSLSNIGVRRSGSPCIRRLVAKLLNRRSLNQNAVRISRRVRTRNRHIGRIERNRGHV